MIRRILVNLVIFFLKFRAGIDKVAAREVLAIDILMQKIKDAQHRMLFTCQLFSLKLVLYILKNLFIAFGQYSQNQIIFTGKMLV